jgi:ferritin-like metal-binding protein YciE
MAADLSSLEKRQDRLELLIEKLTNIQIDLNKMLAVHEQRINSTEKHFDELENVVEKRREESDIKLKDVYDTMRSEDNKILAELNSIRKESTEQHNILASKINEIEKRLWMYIGGVSVIVFVLTHTETIFKILK